MTDVFGMFSHYDTNNNTAANNGAMNNFASNSPNLSNDKGMLQLDNYSSIDYNSSYGFEDGTVNYYQNSNNNQYRMQTEEQSPPHKPEIIHSGHFMVSEIDKDDEADNETTVEEEIVLQKNEKDEVTKDEQVKMKEIEYLELQSTNYHRVSSRQYRKNWNIDYPKLPSLDALFKKMNLGNEGKLTSPKWKHFTGMKIGLKGKIRVNNLIWRVWHIKYVQGKIPKWNPFPPQFNTDSLDNNHVYVAHRPEVMKMGKFFKMSQVNHDFIALEYGKWRRYYKEMIQKQRNKQMTNMNRSFNSYDVFNNNQFDNSNDQFNFPMFSTINYSSAQLGMQAEFMQPDFPYNMQPELMDTFEEPCLQSFLTQKNSFLPTLHEEPIQEPNKIQQNIQTIYSTTDNTMNTDINANYEQQSMQQVNNQMNNQMSNLQRQQQSSSTQQQLQVTSPVNYNFMGGYQPQQQPNPMQNQQQQTRLSSMSYRQNYVATNNLIVDQQSRQSAISNQQSTGLSTMVQNQTRNVLIPMDQNQVNNSQFMMPKPVKPKIRSRSVSSLPQQQQVALQRQHGMENSSSLMEINQPILSNQSTSFHNTTSNLASTQGDLQRQQNQSLTNQLQNSLSNLDQMIPERANNYAQRRSALVSQGSMINQQQVMQTTDNTNYYNINLNSRTTQTSNTSLSSIDYTNNPRQGMCNQSNSSSYYSNQSQQSIGGNSNNSMSTSIRNQNLNTILSSSNTSNYNSNTGTNLISQLLSTNNSKSVTSNLQTQSQQQTTANNNAPQFKRNSTGTYPSTQQFNQQQYASSDQFVANDRLSNSSSTSISNLTMSSSNVNSNSKSSSGLQSTNELYPNRTSQLIRESSNQSATNQTFLFSNGSNTMNSGSLVGTSPLNHSITVQQQTLLNNSDLLVHQQSNHNSSNLTSSQESLNKNLSTKSHRIKRENHRKLSTGKLRTNSTSLSRSKSTKSINAHSPISPTTSLQSTLHNQSTSGKSQSQQISTPINNDFLSFDRDSNLMIASSTGTLNSNLNSNLPTNSNLNANSSPLSSSSTIQSPLANSPFTSTQNDYSNDSIGMYNNQPFVFLNQSTVSSASGQQLKPINSTATSHSSNIGPGMTPSNSNPIKHERDPNRYREHRRVCHINAEQKRRCNIKNGFDTLRAILPSISSNNNTKISKAAMLQKGAEHIRHLRIEQDAHKEEIEALRAQISSLNQTIGIFQNQLPATGAPIAGMRPGQIKECYQGYVREKTQQNWKFWMFSIIMEPLLDSYNNTIPTTNFDELTSSVLRWLDQSCNLINLRREVLNSLRIISTTTNVLTDPSSLSQESLAKVTKKQQQQSNKKKQRM